MKMPETDDMTTSDLSKNFAYAIGRLEASVSSMASALRAVDARVSAVDNRVGSLETKVDEKVSDLQKKVDEKVTDLQRQVVDNTSDLQSSVAETKTEVVAVKAALDNFKSRLSGNWQSLTIIVIGLFSLLQFGVSLYAAFKAH